jgi:hypothetical protein
MPLDSDEFQEAALERSLGQEFQVPHYGVFRKSQSFSRTARERYIYLKHRRKSSKKNQTIHSKYHQHEAISSHMCNSPVYLQIFQGLQSKSWLRTDGLLGSCTRFKTEISGIFGEHPNSWGSWFASHPTISEGQLQQHHESSWTIPGFKYWKQEIMPTDLKKSIKKMSSVQKLLYFYCTGYLT